MVPNGGEDESCGDLRGTNCSNFSDPENRVNPYEGDESNSNKHEVMQDPSVTSYVHVS